MEKRIIKAEKEELWRLDKIMEKTGFSKASIYRKMKEGTFPRNVKLGSRARAWRSSRILRWMDELEET